VQRHFAEPLRIEQIAEAAGLSTDQLKRSMHRSLGVSPKQFLVRTRIDQAAFLLTTTDDPISSIATTCGFYDQSQLTRQFTAAIGQPPGTYRSLSR
jgi:transcriptional regulator GlxA family with amidase domain